MHNHGISIFSGYIRPLHMTSGRKIPRMLLGSYRQHNMFLKLLKFLHPCLNFTMEIGENNSINFLDITKSITDENQHSKYTRSSSIPTRRIKTLTVYTNATPQQGAIMIPEWNREFIHVFETERRLHGPDGPYWFEESMGPSYRHMETIPRLFQEDSLPGPSTSLLNVPQSFGGLTGLLSEWHMHHKQGESP
ncbi:hypothetical protein J437_LFUL014387 [Ladona fulva]|uniref:Uncharacterized protein n=1 Tax=Ladona fulva TaxID=123851 RepID=A0A8K0KJ02_LADFU|nr:hypothetical protein J437_LFUL014387 [Ladona fulva]